MTDFGPWAIWAWLLGVSIALIGAAFVMPKEPVRGNEEGDFLGRLKEGVGLLKNRRFALLIFAAGILQATHGYFYGFGVLIWTKDQAISQTVAGNLWSGRGGGGSAVPDVPWRLVEQICVGNADPGRRCRLHHSLDGDGLPAAGMGAVAAAGAARRHLCGGVPGRDAAGQQMMGDEQTATAQMIYMALASAPAQAFTTFVSGYLYDALVADGDAALGYLAMTGVSVVGLVLALMLWVTRAKPNAQLAPA